MLGFGEFNVNVQCGLFWEESTYDIVGVLGILEQKEIVKFRLSQLLILFLVFIQLLNGTTRW